MEQTDFLKDMQKLLHGEYYEKKFKLKDDQTIWLQKETRQNMYKILKFMHDNDVIRKKMGFYYLEKIYSNLKMDHRVARHALIIMCMARNNPIRMVAWQMFNNRTEKNSPKKLLFFRINNKL